jgi:hypothetical protein
MSDFFSNASFMFGNYWHWLVLALAIGAFFGYSTCERVDTRRHS